MRRVSALCSRRHNIMDGLGAHSIHHHRAGVEKPKKRSGPRSRSSPYKGKDENQTIYILLSLIRFAFPCSMVHVLVPFLFLFLLNMVAHVGASWPVR